MALIIKTTGLEQYAPGGDAHVRLLCIGDYGAGKTPFSAQFPKPIIASCEDGLASVARMRVPYVDIKNSQDMLDYLDFLKKESMLPVASRQYQTVVIDTIDAFQRKLKLEWMDRNGKPIFTGWDAWGWLNAKMSTILTKLLNLNMNVVVNVHYKSRDIKDDETGRESREIVLALQGESGDNIFADFDLIGWLGTYWTPAKDGERQQERGITFRPTPDKPFLRDRLNVTPKWLPITFTSMDYEQIFSAIIESMDDIPEGEVVGEISSRNHDLPEHLRAVAPGAAGTGPLPPEAKRDIPLKQLDKASLLGLVKTLKIRDLPDGTPIRGNTVKSELIQAIEAHREKHGDNPVPETESGLPETAPMAVEEPKTAPDHGDSGTPTGTVEGEQQVPAEAGSAPSVVSPEPQDPAPAVVTADTPSTPAGAGATAPTVESIRAKVDAAAHVTASEAGPVDTTTGELLEEPTDVQVADAVATAEEVLGAEQVAEFATPAPKPAETAPAAALQRAQAASTTPTSTAGTKVCEEDGCGKDLSQEPSQDKVKLAYIKHRKNLCNDHYAARRVG